MTGGKQQLIRTHRPPSIVHRLSSFGRSQDALAAAAALALGGMAGSAAAFGPLYASAGLLVLAACYAMITSTQAGLAIVVAIITLLPFGALPFKAVITPTFLELALAGLMTVWSLRLLARSDTYDLRLTPLG